MAVMESILNRYDTGATPEAVKLAKDEYGFVSNLSGIYMPLQDNKCISSFFRVFIYIVLLLYICYSLFVTAILTENHLNTTVQSIHLAILGLSALIILINCLTKRENFNFLHSIIADNFYTYKSFENCNQKMDNWKNEARKVKYLIYTALILYGTAIFIIIIGGTSFDSLLGYSRAVKTEEIDTRLPVEIWHPYSKLSVITFLGYLLLETLAAGIITSIYIMSLLFFIFSSMSIVMQLKRLQNSIRMIEERAMDNHGISNAGSTKSLRNTQKQSKKYIICNKCILSCIKENAEHHLIIMKAFNILNQILLIPLIVGLLVTLFTSAISLFAIVLEDTNPSVYLLTVILMVAEVASLGAMCYFGQEIRDQSIEVQYTLYEINWTELPKEAMLSIRIMKERLKRPLVLGGPIPFTYETFSSVINVSFKLFKLLLAAKDGRITALTQRIKKRRM